MELKQALTLSNEVVNRLAPFCKNIMVVGSVRRKKEIVHDIDIVLIPRNQGALAVALRSLGPKIKAGPAIYSCIFSGAEVELYIADETTWPTLVLIRTGSKEHNIKLCSQAKSMGLKLHADGSGISSDGQTIMLPKTEADIFDILGIPYVPPEKR